MKNETNESFSSMWNEHEQRKSKGRIWGGLILVSAGALWLAKTMGVIIPSYIFSWPVLLIAIGFYTLAKNNFKKLSGFIIIAIGGIFLAERLVPDVQLSQFAWPVLIIIGGLFMILRPKQSKSWKSEKHQNKMGEYNSDADFVNINSIFGGVEKTVISKNFKGGEINCIFGGTELNLMQADITGKVTLEMNQIFGGTELIVPAHWRVITEINSVFGGVEDHRVIGQIAVETDKILVLHGNAVFGGIEIKSFG